MIGDRLFPPDLRAVFIEERTVGDQYGFRDEPTSAENILVTTRDVLAATPGKFLQEIHNDLQNPTKLATVGVVSTGVGFGATALLTKFPKVGGYAMAGLAGVQVLRYGANTLDFFGEASDANNEYRRKMLVERASTGLGREGAILVESTPGLILGGSLAVRAVGTPQAFRSVGSWTDRNVVQPVKSASVGTREFVAEKWAFRGPGSKPLPGGILHEEGTVNALKLSEMLTARHPWTGVETARSVDLVNGRMTKLISGKPASIDFGFADKPGRILFHTHGPESAIGVRPGRFDLLATQDVGIVSRGTQTAFYVGQGREFNAAVAAGAGKTFSPRLQTVILDSEKQSAVLLESVWQTKLSSWQPTVPKYVDYQKARQALSRLDITKPWAELQALPTVPKPQAADDALKLLRTGGI